MSKYDRTPRERFLSGQLILVMIIAVCLTFVSGFVFYAIGWKDGYKQGLGKIEGYKVVYGIE